MSCAFSSGSNRIIDFVRTLLHSILSFLNLPSRRIPFRTGWHFRRTSSSKLNYGRCLIVRLTADQLHPVIHRNY